MGALIEKLLQTAPWTSLECTMGSAVNVPHVFRRLLSAEAVRDADVAYWQLDNVVVLQGRLFPSAVPLIAPIGLALVDCTVSKPARYRLAELLTEFALGEPHESIVDPGILSAAINIELHRQTGVVYSLLADEDARVRRDAIEILLRIDGEVDRLRNLAPLLGEDEDEGVRTLVRSRL